VYDPWEHRVVIVVWSLTAVMLMLVFVVALLDQFIW